MAYDYVVSLLGSLDNEKFRSVDAFCMFLGSPRSGSTLLGSLLDAHPNAVIATELDVLKHLDRGFGRTQIYYLVVKRSEWFASRGSAWNDYQYSVPGQWQGRFDTLRVLGDKKAGATVLRLMAKPQLLQSLKRTIGKPIRFVHVIRNPYDNIATLHRKQGGSLEHRIERYFAMARAVVRLRDEIGSDAILDVRHESLLEDPRVWLTNICTYLNLNPSHKYLDDCSKIVHSSPRKSRHDVEWREEYIEAIQNGIDNCDFLRGYTFDT